MFSDSHHAWCHSDLEERLTRVEVALGIKDAPAEKPEELPPPSAEELAAAQAVLARAGREVVGK